MEGERRWLERKVERKRDRGWKERHCSVSSREREREREDQCKYSIGEAKRPLWLHNLMFAAYAKL